MNMKAVHAVDACATIKLEYMNAVHSNSEWLSKMANAYG